MGKEWGHEQAVKWNSFYHGMDAYACNLQGPEWRVLKKIQKVLGYFILGDFE
jgi:hypothetical protein